MKKIILGTAVLLLFSISILIFQISCTKDTPPVPVPLVNVISSPVTLKLEILVPGGLITDRSYLIKYALLYPGQAWGGSNDIREYIRDPTRSWIKTFTVTSNERPLWLYTSFYCAHIGDKVIFNCYIDNVLFVSRTEVTTMNNETVTVGFGPFN